LKLSLPEPVEGNVPAENHLRQAQVAMNCVTPKIIEIRKSKIENQTGILAQSYSSANG
jgi:hypothetical protein